MTVTGTGAGAGTPTAAWRANVVRLVVGDSAEPLPRTGPRGAVVLATNVDDLDPRVLADGPRPAARRPAPPTRGSPRSS